MSNEFSVEALVAMGRGVSYALKAAKTFGKIRENINKNL